MKSSNIVLSLILLLTFFMWSCQEQVSSISNPEDTHSLQKPGKGKGKDKVVFSVKLVEADGFNPINPILLTGCDGWTDPGQYSINWERHDGCATITPTPAEGVGIVTLTDDPYMKVVVRRGRIIEIQFEEQDVIGPEGIQYSTNKITIDPPIVPNAEGFIIPVREDGIEVWRHKGHTGGPRVEMVGYISIGNIVYEPISP